MSCVTITIIIICILQLRSCYHVIVLLHKEFAGSVKNLYNLIFVHRYYSFQVGADKGARSERVAESA